MRFHRSSARLPPRIVANAVEQLESRVVLDAAPPLLAPDWFEPNDTFESATELGAVGHQTHVGLTIHISFNVDCYRFTAAPGTLTVALNFPHASGDLGMRLLDAAGNPIASSDGETDTESVRWPVTGTQSFYVLVYGNSWAMNTYGMTMDVSDVPTDRFEPNDTLATATDLGVLGDRAEAALTIHQVGNSDYYRFTTLTPGSVDVHIGFPHSSGDLSLQLLNAAGNVLAVSTGTNDIESVSTIAAAGQTLYVRVYGENGATNTYDMVIRGPTLPPDRMEANDAIATATSLPVAGDGTFSSLNLHTGNDNDYYRLTTAAAGTLTVTLTFDHILGDVDMQLLNAAGDVVATSAGTGNTESVTRAVGAGEVYVIRVYGVNGTNPDYTMEVNGPDLTPDRFEPNDTRATATDLGTLGDWMASGLSIHGPLNDDYYRFTAAATGPFIASIQFSNALGNLDMQLLDAAGQVIAGANSHTDAEGINVSVTAGQTYYLQVFGLFGAINPRYDMTLHGPAPVPAVAGRYVFYNHSSLDGNNLAPTAGDDAAIAGGKQALLPNGTAGFANLTSYSRGINGVMVDVAGLPAGNGPTAADFKFKVGTSGSPGAWVISAAPTSVSVRRGAGANGSDRVTILWADNAIQNQWLQVTALANAVTGLANPDVFYFGNLIGEVTGGAAPVVNAMDVERARLYSGSTSAAALAACDFNRDGAVNALDVLIARVNQRHALPGLSAPAAVSASSSADAVSSAISPARRTALRTVRQGLLG